MGEPADTTRERTGDGDIRARPRSRRHALEPRRRLGWSLTALMLSIYFGFILAAAFGRDLLGSPAWPAAVTTVGIPAGLLVILAGVVLTGVYAIRTDGKPGARGRNRP